MVNANIHAGKKIKLSMCIVTYNQKKYLRECLDSVINQTVDFEYEIIVGDDASSDGTSDLIMDYYREYADLIIPVWQKKNKVTTND